MSTRREQRKLKKQKAREKESREKVLSKRDISRKKAKKDREAYRAEKEQRRHIRAVARLEEVMDEIYDRIPEDVRAQIEHNEQILKALEQEHEKIQEERDQRVSELKERGAESLDDMVKMMHDDVVEQQGGFENTDCTENSTDEAKES